jgi:hypothetical protein
MNAPPLIRPLDWLLLALLAALIGLAAAQAWTPERAAGQTASVHVHGERVLRLPLGQDGRWHVQGAIGESMIETQAGRVRFAAAPCSHRRCLAAGWLSRAGQSATCLPNRVHLEVDGRDARFDSYNY